LKAGIKLVLVLTLCPQVSVGQGFLEQFSYEGLRFSGVGFEVGGVVSNRLTRELTGGVRIDYGRIAPNVRVLIGVSYFKGEFNESEIREFALGIQRVVIPATSYVIDIGSITWSDIEADLDLQYVLEAGSRVTNYVGVGFAAHVRNGTGAVIDDTFVEDALDSVDAGLNLSIGTAIELVPTIQLTIDLRGGLASELRTASARAGLMYRIASGG
jgi:hypothetical protein